MNTLTKRIAELQTAMDSLKGSTDPAADSIRKQIGLQISLLGKEVAGRKG